MSTVVTKTTRIHIITRHFPWVRAVSFALLLGGCSVNVPVSVNEKPAKDAGTRDASPKDAGKTDAKKGDATNDCQDNQEVCDGKDNNCDGETDEAPASGSCLLSHATARCVSGACDIDKCDDLFGNCDNKTDNGCEAPLDMATHCGQCDRSCLNMAHATGANCIKGACEYDKCQLGYGDCDGDKTNGCEQALDTLAHCGVCNRACSGTSCVGGGCTSATCSEGFADCDGNAENGCEASVKSANNCIVCGNTCSIANAAGSCDSGKCEFKSCKFGYGDCDRDLSNGCEAALNTISDCGACGTRCGEKSFCTGGKCTLIQCLPNKADCDQNTDNGCEVFLTSVDNCGACGNKCEQVGGQSATCQSGTCQLDQCATGTAECDKDPATVCESTLKDNTNCGACGSVCTLVNATASCASGKCELVGCNARFGNCDGDPANGCETPLNSATHCGKCNYTCPETGAHATGGACANGVCGFTCESGWGNCNNDPTDGCETNLLTSQQHCGVCNNGCETTQHCCGDNCRSIFIPC